LLESIPGGTLYAIQGLLERANDFVAGFVICRRQKESGQGLRVALNRFCISHEIRRAKNPPRDSASKRAGTGAARLLEGRKARFPPIRYTGLGFRFLVQFAPSQEMKSPSEAEVSKCESPPFNAAANPERRNGIVESARHLDD